MEEARSSETSVSNKPHDATSQKTESLASYIFIDVMPYDFPEVSGRFGSELKSFALFFPPNMYLCAPHSAYGFLLHDWLLSSIFHPEEGSSASLRKESYSQSIEGS
jgi:hypothetical protein